MARESRWMNILSTWCGLGTKPEPEPQGASVVSEGFGLVARYGRRLEISYRLAPACQARMAVLRSDGSKVVSLNVADHACGMSLPVDLPRGEYLVLVEGGRSRFVAPVRVAA